MRARDRGHAAKHQAGGRCHPTPFVDRLRKLPGTLSKPIYFHGPDGVRYRVLDCTWRAGRFIPSDPPALPATVRIFRPKEGPRRLYRFAPVEARGMEQGELARQLSVAEFLPEEQPGTSER